MYTLTVLETAVKNCDQRFRALVCQREFVNELVKLISAKYETPQIIQERVLSLIQSWADAFRGCQALSGVVEIYDELKLKGVEFPAADFDLMAPIITPKRTIFESSQDPKLTAVETSYAFPPINTENAALTRHQVDPSSGPVTASPEQMAKLRSELDIVNVNMAVLRELIGTQKPNQEPSEDHQLIEELNSTCREMQKRILELIPVISNEEITYELLFVNDELNAIFEKYNRCLSNRNAQSSDTLETANDSKKQISSPAPDDLIDLGTSDPNYNMRLSSQLQSIEEKASSSKTHESASYINDQIPTGLHTVAFDKTTPISDRQSQRDSVQKPQSDSKKTDDGL